LKKRIHLLKDDLLEHETLEFYCSKEEDRVHEGKTGGRQNYLRHTNRDKCPVLLGARRNLGADP
jgi:hypothetical protein